MRKLSRALLSTLALAAGLGLTPRAEASIVERVVAVVGDKPILLSDLRHRARPYLFRIVAQTQNRNEQAAAENQMFKELLDRMIDDRLEESAAEKARLTVTPEEVDNGIRNVAAASGLDPRALVAEARKQGLTEQDYRDEMRRQVLEGKLVQLRVRGRVRVSDQEARAAYSRWVRDLSDQQPVEIRLIALRLLPSMTPEEQKARHVLAEEITRRAKAGEDFCQLVEAYSDDASTKATCGSRGPQPLQTLIAPIRDVASRLGPGEVEGPIAYGQDVLLVVQLRERPDVPAFEKVKDQMLERAYGEAMERQRKLWLQELRRGVYVDVRL